MYSAANLNRPIAKCAVCKLDHAPLKPDLLEARAKRKEAKREKKKQDIQASMLSNIEQCKKRQEVLQPQKEFMEIEAAFKAREAKQLRMSKMYRPCLRLFYDIDWS